MRRAVFLALAAAVRGCKDDPEVADQCKTWHAKGECEANPVYMTWHCGTLCGCTPPPTATNECADRDTTGNCAVWARGGECEKNPTFMKLKCAASCNTCDMLNFTKRCPPLNQTAAVAPGEMGEMFMNVYIIHFMTTVAAAVATAA